MSRSEVKANVAWSLIDLYIFGEDRVRELIESMPRKIEAASKG